jgi:hypothetical protein
MTTTCNATDFRVTDSEFPLIAANAALEVDNVIQGQNGSFENVTRLSKLLEKAIIRDTGQVAKVKSLMDPVSTGVFSRAFLKSHKRSLKSLNELAAEAYSLSTQLGSIDGKREMLQAVRDFCVALSKLALASRPAVQHCRLRNPHRR